jgi:hypothetical protein
MKKKNKLTPKDFFICLLGLLVYLIFIHTLDKTLNYPIYIYYGASLAVGIIIFLIGLKTLKAGIKQIKSVVEKAMFIGVDVFKSLFIALFLLGAILIPLNYYNFEYSKSNPAKIYFCQIESLTSSSRNHCVYFLFENKINLVNGHKPIMDEIHMNNNFERYVFVATARKALFGTFVLEEWHLQHK